MQTFTCYYDHRRTMAILDNERLNKQCLETVQILRVLRGERDGYTYHPAVRMWEGHEPALLLYGLAACYEYRVKRGKQHDSWHRLEEMSPSYWDPRTPLENERYEAPGWLKNKWVLRSHRSNLVRKAPHHYEELFPGTPELMPYLWPRYSLGGWDLYLSKPDQNRLETGERVLPEGLKAFATGAVVALDEGE